MALIQAVSGIRGITLKSFTGQAWIEVAGLKQLLCSDRFETNGVHPAVARVAQGTLIMLLVYLPPG